MASQEARSKLPAGMVLRGRIYYARFKHGGREVRKRLSSDLRVATTMLRDLRGRIERNEWGLVDNDCPWSELKKEFLAFIHQTLRSAKDIEADINRFEKYRSIQNVKQLTHSYIIGYRQWRMVQRIGKPPAAGEVDDRPYVSVRTINREVGSLRNMLNKGKEWGLLGVNPIEKLKPLKHDTPVKARRALSLEEIQSLFSVTPAYLLPLFKFILETGVRRNEAASLRWSDIDFDQRTVYIRPSVAKSRKGREIPLGDEMVEILRRLRSQADGRQVVPSAMRERSERQRAKFSKEHVFVTKANTPWGHNLLLRFYTYAQRAGIVDAAPRGAVDIHSLRSTFASHAIDHGASPKSVQSLLGHSTLELTMNCYSKATDRGKRAAVGCLPYAGQVSAPDHVLKISDEQKSGRGGDKHRPGALRSPQTHTA